MLNSTTYENAVISLRREICNAINLKPDFLINSDSLYGPEIRQQLTAFVSKAPDLMQPFVIFEFREIENDSFGATQYDDETMISLMPYGLFLKIYGNFCHITAQKILALFKNPAVSEKLYYEGLKILNVSSPTSVNEFINNVRWQRCDIQVSFICRFDINLNKNLIPEDIDQLSMPINIIKI